MIAQIVFGILGGVGLAAAVWAVVTYVQSLRRVNVALVDQLTKAHREISDANRDRENAARIFQTQTIRLERTIDELRAQKHREIKSGADVARSTPSSAGRYLSDSLQQATRIPAFVPGVVADEPMHPPSSTDDPKRGK